MQAKDIMTTSVVSIGPEASIQDAAQLMLDNHISGLPVVDADGKPVGLISEGDLMHRSEIGTERRRPWWLRMVTSTASEARDFVKEHAQSVADVMSKNVITIDEAAPLGDIAEVLESEGIKRLPVVRDEKLVGIVSRSNLLRALASHPAQTPSAPKADDRNLREAVQKALDSQEWASSGALNPMVSDGVVEVWGYVTSKDERRALLLTVEQVPGVKKVIDRLGSMPSYLRGT